MTGTTEEGQAGLSAVPGNAVREPVRPSAVPLQTLTTFDCFDTVLTRAVGSPDSVGYVTGLRLHRTGVVDVDAGRFAAARVEAARLAWRRHGDRYTLRHIAAELAELLDLAPDTAPVLLEAELRTERELSREVPGIRQQIEAHRSGSAIGFLSDTPLPHELLEELLRRHELIVDGDRLWVSNELGAGKGRGNAFAAVVERLSAAPGTWKHLGDDARADVRNARLSGVRAVHLPAARLNRYEELLERDRSASGGLSSVMAGASRRTRLLLSADRPDIPAGCATVAAGVAGPVLAGYVLWCLRQAESAGCRRLYFVARDGEVLLDMARVLAQGLDVDLDLRYLHGSRKAWLLPRTAGERREYLQSVAGREERVTVQSTLSWFALPPERIEQPLRSAGFPPESWSDRLDPAGLDRLAELVEDPAVDEVLAREAAERRRAAGGYLAAAGLLDGEPFGIVEMTGRGTIGRFLTDVLGSLGGGPPALELYFGLESDVRDSVGRCLRAYMYDDSRGIGISRREDDLWVLLEAFTQARHGHVSHYAQRDGGYLPVGSDQVNESLLAWGLEHFRDGLDVFCRELASALPHVDVRGNVRRSTWEVLRTFWVSPTAAEVAAWRDYPLEGSAVAYPIGHGFSRRQVVGTVVSGRPRLRGRGTWPSATRQAAPTSLKLAMVALRLTASGLRRGTSLRRWAQRRRTVRRGV